MVDVVELQVSKPNPVEGEQKKIIFKTYAIIWYLTGLLEFVLAFRFLLLAFAANRNSSFVSFIYALSEPFAAPFKGIFGIPSQNGFVLDFATLLAMGVYFVLAFLIAELLRILKPVSSQEADQKLEGGE